MHAIGRSAPYALLLCAAVYLLTVVRQLEFPRAPGRLGPDVWPQALLVLLIVACVLGIANALWAKPADAQPATLRPAAGGDDGPDAPSRYGLVAAGTALFLAYPLGLQHLGFVVATFLLMASFMLVGLWRNVPGVLAASAVGTLALFFIFRGVVYISLPLGAGPFQAFTLGVARLMGMQ